MEAEEFQLMFEKNQDYTNVDQKPGEMSPLERFEAIMSFKSYDRMIDTEFGYWNDTLRRWHQEGLPEYVDNNSKADLYFGFDLWKKNVPGNVFLCPAFPEEMIKKGETRNIIRNHEKVLCEIFSDGTDTIPHYLDFPIKTREDYLPFKERLQPYLEKRIRKDLTTIEKQTCNRNYVLQAQGGSTAGKIRNWMGFDGICFAIYDQPELLDEILDDFKTLSSAVAGEICSHLKPDLISWWEDVAFKTGPIVTPDWFISKCGPVYKKVMDIYHEAGTKYAFVDCDGDFRKLLPGWLENGVNILFPLEVAAGIHPETLRRDYPGIRMMGGFDKMVLLGDKADIKKELQKLKKLADEGGFIPHVDHRVQADVTYANYIYYLQTKREIFELPNTTNAGKI